ncbi:M20 aminoacylase family protein [soil metagenome]
MISESVTRYAGELVAMRHDLHQHPELLFDLKRTSAIVARELAAYGYQVTTGIAETGVVGTLSLGSGRKSIGIRADMDALPIHEKTNLPYASRTPGKMHACGHDGHTATLLGAARYLAETRNFDGTLHLIFQPAEEDIGGAKRMIEEGLFTRFPCDAVFAFHNMPGFPVGQFLARPGVMMAAVDIVKATITGVGGHGAVPHKAVDPVVAASAVVMALQTVVSRNIDPVEPAVITVGAFTAGNFSTIIPEQAVLDIGIRSCNPAIREQLARRIPEIIKGTAAAYGCRAGIEYDISYPATINHAAETALARSVAVELGGGIAVGELAAPFMVSEDFAYMLEQVPGCYFMLGAGDEPGRRMLHDPGYDFNDALLVPGAALWARLAETVLRA